MSDLYNNNPEGFTPPQAPAQPTPPPMAPQSQSFAPQQQTPQPQAPQQIPQQPYAPVYGQPQRPPMPPQQPYYGNGYAPAPQGYYPGYPPQKPKSNTGLKVLLVVISTLLVASIAGFTIYIANNSPKGFVEDETTPSSGFSFNLPSSPDSDEQEKEQETYPESDAKDKVNPDYKGVKLNKKPAKSTKKNHGTTVAFNKVEKSVVGIIAYTDGQEGTAEDYSSMGSGTVLTSDGYIVTNAHIIDNSRTAYRLKVITYDNKEYKAGVVGYDGRSDLAVLKIDAKNLTPAEFGDSGELEITEEVMVVGNPMGLKYQNSVTKGIVSALNRSASARNNVKYIQTDAAINPGNSGGPLCNLYGQVVGISSSKIALEEYEGMCFAIPTATVKSVVNDIVRKGYVQGRVKIGITGQMQVYNDKYDTGIEIGTIDKNGPLDNTEAQSGDIVIKLDGKKAQTFSDIYDLLAGHKAGDKVELTLYRPSTDKTFTVTITLQEDKAD